MESKGHGDSSLVRCELTAASFFVFFVIIRKLTTELLVSASFSPGIILARETRCLLIQHQSL